MAIEYNLIDSLPVLHFCADFQKELTKSFIRMAEFYESPYEEIRGKLFDLNKYKKLYAKDHNNKFSYYTDWSGFNIPSTELKRFHAIFDGSLTKNEQFIFNAIEETFGDIHTRKQYYIIGTYKSNYNSSTFHHEIAHSLFTLKRKYKAECDRIYKKIPTSMKEKIHSTLKEVGYSSKEYEDETQAYFSTDKLSILIDRFNIKDEPSLIEITYAYQHNYGLYIPDD